MNSWKTIKNKTSTPFRLLPHYATASGAGNWKIVQHMPAGVCKRMCVCVCVASCWSIVRYIDRYTHTLARSLAPVTAAIHSFIDLSFCSLHYQLAKLPHVACPNWTGFCLPPPIQCAICRSCCCCCFCLPLFYGNIQVSIHTVAEISCLLLHQLIDSYLRQHLLPLLQHSACHLRRLRASLDLRLGRQIRWGWLIELEIDVHINNYDNYQEI